MEFKTISKIFTGSDYYAVPDYQRDYEWGNAENSTLSDDIFDLLNLGSNEKHFIGAIVTIPFDKENAASKQINYPDFEIDEDGSVKHLVDGQQRLTSVSIFIAALK